MGDPQNGWLNVENPVEVDDEMVHTSISGFVHEWGNKLPDILAFFLKSTTRDRFSKVEKGAVEGFKRCSIYAMDWAGAESGASTPRAGKAWGYPHQEKPFLGEIKELAP